MELMINSLIDEKGNFEPAKFIIEKGCRIIIATQDGELEIATFEPDDLFAVVDAARAYLKEE